VIGKICGSMRKRVWIKIGDIVLISTRSFDSTSCDIIHKYTDDEAHCLKNYGEIPANVNLSATSIELSEGKLEHDPVDIGFEFTSLNI
jgi:translation initiation factor 1A